MTQIKWKAGTQPTGRFRSFDRWEWPCGFVHTEFAIWITCEDPYLPARARGEVPHAPLIVRLRLADGKRVRLKAEFATLDEAKRAAQQWVDENPSRLPQPPKPPPIEASGTMWVDDNGSFQFQFDDAITLMPNVKFKFKLVEVQE